MRRLTRTEAIEAIETIWETGPDFIMAGLVEATVVDVSVQQARSDVDSYLAAIAGAIDPDSITIRRDEIEGSDMDAVTVSIKTGEEA